MIDNEHWVRDVGFVVHEDEKCIVFAGTWLPEQHCVDEIFSAVQKIPLTWIRNRVVLAVVDGGPNETTVAIAPVLME